MQSFRIMHRFSTLTVRSSSRIISSAIMHRTFCTIKPQSDEKDMPKEESVTDDKENLSLGDMKSKYEVFNEQDADVILDVYEERQNYNKTLLAEEELKDPYEGINLKRGVHGVFDLEDLLDLLQRENGQNVCVVSVPERMKYVDYLVFVTGRSAKHMIAIAQFIRKVYKKKRNPTDPIPSTDGESASPNWIALDIGNIAVHIFTDAGRRFFDIEQLWAVGANFDSEFNKEDAFADLMARYSVAPSDNSKPAT